MTGPCVHGCGKVECLRSVHTVTYAVKRSQVNTQEVLVLPTLSEKVHQWMGEGFFFSGFSWKAQSVTVEEAWSSELEAAYRVATFIRVQKQMNVHAQIAFVHSPGAQPREQPSTSKVVLPFELTSSQ